MLARTPAHMITRREKLSIVPGDILDAEAVVATIRGTDAVMSVLGPTHKRPEFVISKGTDLILNAMRQHDVRRLILSGGAGVWKLPNNQSASSQHERHYRYLYSSDLCRDR